MPYSSCGARAAFASGIGQAAFWSFVAVATWTPIVIVLAAWLGPHVTTLLSRYTGGGWPAVLLAEGTVSDEWLRTA